ncbi:hypothetical protein HK100_000146, partial [Physocladia obscura]
MYSQASDAEAVKREAARLQWLKELDEQRKKNIASKKKEALERKEPQLVYSSLFETPQIRCAVAPPAEPQRENKLNLHPESRSFFLGGYTVPSATITGPRRRTLSEIKQLQTSAFFPPPLVPVAANQHPSGNTHLKSESSESEQVYSSLTDQMESNSLQQNPATYFGRIRSKFLSQEEDVAMRKQRETEEWRESLKRQIEDKKKREEEEKKKDEVAFKMWEERERAVSNSQSLLSIEKDVDRITGGPVRRSAKTIESNHHHEEMSSFEISKNNGGKGAESSVENTPSRQSKAVPLVSKIPKPVSKIPHRPNASIDIANNINYKLSSASILPPLNPISKVETSPVIKKHIDQPPDTRKSNNIEISTNLARSPSPPFDFPTRSLQIPQLSPTKKLNKILNSVKIGYDTIPDTLEKMKTKSSQVKKSGAVNKSKSRPKSAFGRTLPVPAESNQKPVSKKKLLGVNLKESSAQHFVNHQDDFRAHAQTHQEVENQDFKTILNGRKQNTASNKERPEVSNDVENNTNYGHRGISTKQPLPEKVLPAGTSTGRSLTKAEYTPHGTLRPPWGTNDFELSQTFAAQAVMNLDDNSTRPPWGIDYDVPVRVVGRERIVG